MSGYKKFFLFFQQWGFFTIFSYLCFIFHLLGNSFSFLGTSTFIFSWEKVLKISSFSGNLQLQDLTLLLWGHILGHSYQIGLWNNQEFSIFWALQMHIPYVCNPSQLSPCRSCFLIDSWNSFHQLISIPNQSLNFNSYFIGESEEGLLFRWNGFNFHVIVYSSFLLCLFDLFTHFWCCRNCEMHDHQSGMWIFFDFPEFVGSRFCSCWDFYLRWLGVFVFFGLWLWFFRRCVWFINFYWK